MVSAISANVSRQAFALTRFGPFLFPPLNPWVGDLSLIFNIMKFRASIVLGSSLMLLLGVFIGAQYSHNSDKHTDSDKKNRVTGNRIVSSRPSRPLTPSIDNSLQMTDAYSFLHTYGKTTQDIELIGLLGKIKGVSLTKEQRDELQLAYSVIFNARIGYELYLAKVGHISDTSYVIEIPQYNEMGASFQKALQRSFSEIIGDDIAMKVMDQISTEVDANNQYWGLYAQSIKVEYDVNNNSYKISHVNVPSEVGGPSRAQNSVLQPGDLDRYEQFAFLFPKPKK